MDEPLSNLDAKQRVTIRSEITDIHRKVKATTVYVTHDQTEAMTMADRIVVMKDGYIQQVGTPYELYFNPANMFVAGFIGEPPMNFVTSALKDGKINICSSEIDLQRSSLMISSRNMRARSFPSASAPRLSSSANAATHTQ